MRKLVYGLYAIAVVAALCLVVALTKPEPPTPPPATEPSTIPTIPTTAPTEPAPVGEIRLYQCDPERYTGNCIPVFQSEGVLREFADDIAAA